MLMFRVVFRLTSILKRSRLELERAIGQFSLGDIWPSSEEVSEV
jgi:hypothetical protein